MPLTAARAGSVSVFAPIGPPDSTWRSLGQSWLPTPEPAFQPGWARFLWTPEALIGEAVFSGRQQSNRGTHLNDWLWELGDVCELFVKREGEPRYLEIHVSPENARLQLAWDLTGHPRLAAGEGKLDDFLVEDPAWVSSTVRRSPVSWAVRISIPASRLGLESFSLGIALRAAVCRYDYNGNPVAALSSTAPLSVPSYHRWMEWSLITLV